MTVSAAPGIRSQTGVAVTLQHPGAAEDGSDERRATPILTTPRLAKAYTLAQVCGHVVKDPRHFTKYGFSLQPQGPHSWQVRHGE